VRGSSELTATGRHLHASSPCTSSPGMIILLPSVVEPTLASALPRRRSLRGRPHQGITVRNLVALRAGLSRAATLQLHLRISALPTPRAATPPRACATHSSAYRARQAHAPTLLLRPPSVRTLLLPLQPSHCFRCAAPSSRACSLLPSEPAPHGLARPRREPLARLPARPLLHLRALARATASPSLAPRVRAPAESPHTALAHTLLRVAHAYCRARSAHRSAPCPQPEPPATCPARRRTIACAPAPAHAPSARLAASPPASALRQPQQRLSRRPSARLQRASPRALPLPSARLAPTPRALAEPPQPGLANPWGRLTPKWAPWPTPSGGWLTGGSLPYPLSVCRHCTSVCPTKWALFVSVTQDTIFCDFLLCLLCFPLISYLCT
jgi:hypothetical protein